MTWKLQQLRKSSTDRLLEGVCGGLGESTPVPALVWRVAFVLTTLSGGAGLIVYLLMWWQMPATGSADAIVGNTWDMDSLRRSNTDRQIEGICGGLGECTPIPSWLWRVVFVGIIFAGGAGLLVYGLLWLLVPKAGSTMSDA